MSFFDGFGNQDRAILSSIATNAVGVTLRINALVRQLSTFRPEELMAAIDDIRTCVRNAIGKLESQDSQIRAVSAHVEALFKENSELKLALAAANDQISSLKAASAASMPPAAGVDEVELQDLANQLKAAVSPPVAAVAPTETPAA